MTGDLPLCVQVLLRRVLREEVFDVWADTPIARLGGRTPAEAIADGDLRLVVRLVESYGDTGFT